MGIEIERKFLVRAGAWPRTDDGVRYRQGYLCTDPARSVRVRAGGGRAYLTIKGPSVGFSRVELELEIGTDEADRLLEELCVRPLIDKTRHVVEHAGHVWEIDEFHADNAGLVIAEVELDDEAVPVDTPDWIATEVTGDPRYYNLSLVERPYGTWSADEDPAG